MDIQHNTADGQTVLSLRGRFVFNCHRDFRGVMSRSLSDPQREIRIDLGAVDYVDSAGLGLLLMFRERAEAAGKKLRFDTRPGLVEELLTLAGIRQPALAA